ncbi:hypothetical protein ABIE69_003463 [Rhodobacteraceae bacterium MBR-64]|jgi:hypothetical protein
MTAIDKILQPHRDTSVTEREKGTCFEHPELSSFLKDPAQTEEGIPSNAADFEGCDIDLTNPWTAA